MLPYKAKDTDPKWSEADVYKPESFWDWLCLTFGSGFWNHHLMYGLIRVRPR